MNKNVLGIDAGGTKTHAVIANSRALILGEGLSGPGNIASLPIDQAIASITDSSQQAMASAAVSESDIASIVIGIAGASYKSRVEQLKGILETEFPNAAVSVCPDYAIALTAGLNAPENEARFQHGAIVIAGTGSIAYGENSRGKTHRAGGYGYLIDDSGSGYGIGRRAILASLSHVERSGPFTTLTSRVQERFQLAQFREVIEAVYSGKISQSEIASLAKIVSEAAAEDNDEPAAKILMRAGGSLAKLALTVHNALFSDDAAAYPIIAAGSLWNAGPGLTDVFMRTVSRFAPNATVQISEIPPARGAVMKAIANLSS